MYRRLSSFMSPKNPKGSTGDDRSDNESNASTIAPDEALPAPSLKVKRVDEYYSRWDNSRKFRVRDVVAPTITLTTSIPPPQNTNSKVTMEGEVPILRWGGSNDVWKDYCFVYKSLPPPANST